MAGTGGVSTPAVAAAGAGALVLWGALKGVSPTKALLSLLQGKQPSAANTQPITGSGSTGAGGAPLQGPLPGVSAGIPAGIAASGTPAANMALGQLMAGAYGWTGNDWLCLKTGWQEESGWNQYAANDKSDPYNHAYGIPQANPGTKMASAGAAWKSDPATQIRWGLAYIKATYGSPSQVPGWTPNGPSSGYVGY